MFPTVLIPLLTLLICWYLQFVPYILLELPSQIGLRKFGAAIWLSSAVFLWGVVLVGMSFVNTWQQLTACRALIGIFEAALFPGCAYLISCW
jgi:MFS family permease